jgi:endogenous inhibitor of DNA gyrase (YacG/DUF329 family)
MAAKCPICGKEGAQAYRPFCSKRCADIDLGRWLKESYRVPTEEAPGDDDGSGGDGPAGRPTGQAR